MPAWTGKHRHNGEQLRVRTGLPGFATSVPRTLREPWSSPAKLLSVRRAFDVVTQLANYEAEIKVFARAVVNAEFANG